MVHTFQYFQVIKFNHSSEDMKVHLFLPKDLAPLETVAYVDKAVHVGLSTCMAGGKLFREGI